MDCFKCNLLAKYVELWSWAGNKNKGTDCTARKPWGHPVRYEPRIQSTSRVKARAFYILCTECRILKPCRRSSV